MGVAITPTKEAPKNMGILHCGHANTVTSWKPPSAWHRVAFATEQICTPAIAGPRLGILGVLMFLSHWYESLYIKVRILPLFVRLLQVFFSLLIFVCGSFHVQKFLW